jgi:hypothetical protein
MKIDLGSTYDMPEMPIMAKSQSDKPAKHYPTLHIDCGDVLLENLPDSGVMEINFKVVSRSCNERDGKKSCCVTLEVREITDVEEKEEADDAPENATSALDKLAELESAKEDSSEDGEE